MRTTTAILVCLMASTAMAQEQSRVILHGFGEWAYVRTDGNKYLDGTEHGDYDTVGLGLNATAPINDNLTITGQFAVRMREEGQPGAELDYAFAQWKFSDNLKVRIGRSKHPFGIYTEIFDIGTLRPFFHLPLSIYGPSEIAAQSYDGVGLTGTRQTSGSTSIDYDVYVGEISFAGNQRVETDGQTSGTEQVRDVVGGRIRFQTPVDGLSVGGSAYTGILEHEGEEADEQGHARHRGLGVHADYAVAPLTLRAEIGTHRETREGETRAFYLEGAYRLREKWELAARYDRFDVETDDGDETEDHRDLALGVNYWFNPNFVLKLSLHQVKGFAVAVAEDSSSGDKTTAIVFGSQFTF
jgi:predicted porin